jgi:hypothetical protein
VDECAYVLEGLFKGKFTFGDISDQHDKHIAISEIETIINAYKSSLEESIL